MPTPRPPEERFFDKVDLDHPSGCWVWTASLDRRGYGRVCVDSLLYQAHRWSYAFFYGTVLTHDEEGNPLEVDHECRNPSCVKPTHLALVTHAENVRRGRCAEVNRQRYAEQTHCKHGHEFTEANTYLHQRGPYRMRHCRACRAANKRRKGNT